MSESLKPPIERKRPIMLGCTWVAAIYTFVLAAYAQYWQYLHPSLTEAQVAQEFQLWIIPPTIVFLIQICYWHYDDNAYWREYEEYEKQCKQ